MPSFFSTMMNSLPYLSSWHARLRPVGPAPTMSMFVLIVGFMKLLQAIIENVAQLAPRGSQILFSRCFTVHFSSGTSLRSYDHDTQLSFASLPAQAPPQICVTSSLPFWNAHPARGSRPADARPNECGSRQRGSADNPGSRHHRHKERTRRRSLNTH